MCKINPKVDFAFKKLFGSESNKDLLISFINSLMPKEKQIKDLILKNPYNLANYLKGKMSILDIKAIDNNEIWYDIEMQVEEKGSYGKRSFYYWAKTYTEQIESGDDYDKLRKTIVISILDYQYLDEEDYHNVIKPLNIKSKKEYEDLMELHFIELSKFKKDYKELKTALDRWVIFLNRAYEIEKDKIPEELTEDINIKKAIEQLNIMNFNKEEREIYENELKTLRDHKAELKTAEEKGELNKSVEIAKNLLDVLDVETIAKKTGLTIEEVEKLKE